VLELDPRRLDVISKNVVKPLPLLRKVKTLQGFQATNFMEANNAALIECDEELATRA